MTPATLIETDTGDPPRLPSSPVSDDSVCFDSLVQDSSDPNDTDDEYDHSWLNESSDDDEDDEIRDGNADVYDPNDTGKGDDINESDEEADEAKVASSLAMPEEDLRVAKACTDANKAFSATQDSGTPLKRTTHRINESGNSDHIKEVLLDELGPMNTVPRVDILRWISPAYEDLAEESRINEFLRESGEYHKGRWRCIPKNPKLEKVLYDPVCDLWNAILDEFMPARREDMRRAVATDRVKIKHHAIHASSPDICIEASGPSFTLVSGEMIGFSNIAAFIDAKLETDASNCQAHMVQLGGYARQTFIQQPNRMFVRCLIMTQHRARLFHFDRSGVQYTPLFNYHARPRLFVRIVLGLSSLDERRLGLDPSFQWIIGPQGVKLGGTLETVRDDGSVITYDLDMEEDIFDRTSIRGRGTVCWPVRDRETGERVLVKDYWMSEGRTPEYELLQKVRYTPGLCHLISHEEGRPETKDFRGDLSALRAVIFHNRKSIRIIIKFYGTSVDNFKSPEEMLAALRDAIQAHQTLYTMGILHRDITFNNILIGIRGFESEDGERGVLIDLDMAIENVRPILDICKDFRSGTTMFQPIMVTKFFDLSHLQLGKEMIPAQDYLDDLESIFWILVFLLFFYKPNGEKVPHHALHDMIWRFEDAAYSYKEKTSFLNNKSNLYLAQRAIHPDWHASCFQLFRKLYERFDSIHQAKEVAFFEIKNPLPNGTVPNRFSDLLEDVNGNYSYIIELFDDALKAVVDAKKEALIAALNDADAPSSPAVSEPAPVVSTPRKPRTRALRRDSPLVALSLTQRTPKRTRNSNPEAGPSNGGIEDLQSPRRPKRRCGVPGPSRLSQAESFENDVDSDDGDMPDESPTRRLPKRRCIAGPSNLQPQAEPVEDDDMEEDEQEDDF
ncbi:hypothetical protein MD484_g4716, partial [Candolleomyces efflorescens]